MILMIIKVLNNTPRDLFSIYNTFFIYKIALLPLIPPVGILGTPTCGKKIQMSGKYIGEKERNTNGWKMGNMKARKNCWLKRFDRNAADCVNRCPENFL